nr:hypothetical protein [uncultured bacterium]
MMNYTHKFERCALASKKKPSFQKKLPRHFRTTVLTDIYDMTKGIKIAQAAAGHTTAATTLKYYVKGRSKSQNTAEPIAHAYGLD